MKDYFAYQGNPNITGSRDAVREAFSKGLILAGEHWMEMVQSRNQTIHTYNQKVADEIAEKITTVYFKLFEIFLIKMRALMDGDDILVPPQWHPRKPNEKLSQIE